MTGYTVLKESLEEHTKSDGQKGQERSEKEPHIHEIDSSKHCYVCDIFFFFQIRSLLQ